MHTLLLALILAIIAVSLLVFSFLGIAPLKKGKKKISSLDKKKYQRNNPEEERIFKLKEEIDSLHQELAKTKSDYSQVKNEFAQLSIREASLKEQIEKIKTWDNKADSELEKLKKENITLREKLTDKEKEFETQFSLNLNLTKELADKKQKLELSQKDNAAMADEVKSLKSQIIGYTKEIERQNNLILELRNKQQESQWISKTEYNLLKKQLEEKEQELKKIKG